MASKALYITMFLLTFIIVSGGMIYCSTQYENIFQFNFAPASNHAAKSTKVNEDSLKQAAAQQMPKDSASVPSSQVPTVQTGQTVQTAQPVQLAKIAQPEKNKVPGEPGKSDFGKNLKEKEMKVAGMTAQKENEKDSTYIKWKRSTSKFFEAMDAKKAAQIIRKYSDNTARDLLYSMKRKKAAEIIAELSPEYAAKLTREK